MSRRTSTFVALLRGINVTGRNTIRMAELRSLCSELGSQNVETYIQSGNIIFQSHGSAAALEQALERAIERTWKLSIPTLVRSAAEWSGYVQANPFPDVSEREPNRVMLALSKARPLETAVEALQERADAGERIVRVGDSLWIHYAGGAGRSTLSPALLDRLVGSVVTTRNWRTVVTLEEMARGG